MVNNIPDEVPTEEFLLSMLENERLWGTVENLILKHNLPYETPITEPKLVIKLKGTDLHLSKFITTYEPLLQLKKDIPKLAKCEDPILIRGETGTGKEIIARSMIGDRNPGRFRVINCGGMPEHLIESELFGYKRGAFTGALSDRDGLMVSASDDKGGGLFFLDEVGDLPLQAQVKLLRAIQEMKVRPVGDYKEVPINCKFVFATHRNLEKMVEEGTFRQDLYARISTFDIHIPPLEDRRCDITPIIRGMKEGSNFIAAMHKFQYQVDGLPVKNNVRSLQQHVRRFHVLNKLPY